MIRRAVLIAAVVTAGWIFAPAAQGDDTLGFGVNVIPDASDTSEGGLGGTQALWLSLSPGQSITRQFEVISISDVEQLVEGEVLNLQVVDGNDRIDPATPSEVSSWVSFSPTPLVLGPRERTTLSMTVTAPPEADGAFQAFVRLRAVAAQLPESTSDAPASAVVRGALAYDQKMWIGVGSSGSLITDFEIADAVGLTVDGAQTLQIEMVNTGQTPIGPEGTVELQSLELTTLRAGPLTFGTAQILPGESRYAQVELPANVEPGGWRIYVVANQGNIQKTASFDKDLTFPLELPASSPIAIWQIALIVVGILVGVLLIVIGWRLMRAPTSNQAAETVDEPVTSEMVTAPFSSPGASVGVSPVSEAVDEPIVPEEAEGVADTWAQEEADRIFRELGIEDEPRG